MARQCSICQHASRQEIDRGLVSGAPLREISAKYGVSKDALARHRRHLPAEIVRIKAVEDAIDLGELVKHVRSLESKAIGLMKKAEDTGDLRTALSGIREARGCLELLVKMAEVTELERRIAALEAREPAEKGQRRWG